MVEAWRTATSPRSDKDLIEDDLEEAPEVYQALLVNRTGNWTVLKHFLSTSWSQTSRASSVVEVGDGEPRVARHVIGHAARRKAIRSRVSSSTLPHYSSHKCRTAGFAVARPLFSLRDKRAGGGRCRRRSCRAFEVRSA